MPGFDWSFPEFCFSAMNQFSEQLHDAKGLNNGFHKNICIALVCVYLVWGSVFTGNVSLSEGLCSPETCLAVW